MYQLQIRQVEMLKLQVEHIVTKLPNMKSSTSPLAASLLRKYNFLLCHGLNSNFQQLLHSNCSGVLGAVFLLVFF